jgi:hypothetical protein
MFAGSVGKRAIRDYPSLRDEAGPIRQDCVFDEFPSGCGSSAASGLPPNTKVSELLMDREPCRHRWYEQDSGGENITDIRAGYNNRPVIRFGLERKSSVKSPVASSCPVPRSVATVHVGWSVGDRHLALVAQIERARGRPSSGGLTVLSVLDPAVLYHLRPSWLHFLGWCT